MDTLESAPVGTQVPYQKVVRRIKRRLAKADRAFRDNPSMSGEIVKSYKIDAYFELIIGDEDFDLETLARAFGVLEPHEVIVD